MCLCNVTLQCSVNLRDSAETSPSATTCSKPLLICCFTPWFLLNLLENGPSHNIPRKFAFKLFRLDFADGFINMQRKTITGLRSAELDAPNAVTDFFHQGTSLQASFHYQFKRQEIQIPEDSFILGISPSRLLLVSGMERNSQLYISHCLTPYLDLYVSGA